MNNSLNCEACNSAKVRFEGALDSNRVHNPSNPYPFGRSNILVAYNKCADCGFLFSRDWVAKDSIFWNEKIYNEEYKKIVDPDWTKNRAIQVAPLFVRLLRILKDNFYPSVMDYGSGSGMLASLLRQSGVSEVVTYDAYTDDRQLPEGGDYDVIIAVEVFEHEISPQSLIFNFSRLLSDNGVIFFTTKTFKSPKIEYSYVAPRNGHVSIYSPKALKELGEQGSFYYQRIAGGLLHLYSREKLGCYKLIRINFVVVLEKAFWLLKRLSNKIFGIGHE